MKKIILIFITLAVLLSGTLILSSCGGGSNSKKEKAETSPKGPDFKQLFKDCELDSEWATVGSDGSYLSIDTNPKNVGDKVLMGTVSDSLDGIKKVNSKLNLPESLYNKMSETSALDGRQTETYKNVTVSWKYHPDNGLEVTYEAAK